MTRHPSHSAKRHDKAQTQAQHKELKAWSEQQSKLFGHQASIETNDQPRIHQPEPTTTYRGCQDRAKIDPSELNIDHQYCSKMRLVRLLLRIGRY